MLRQTQMRPARSCWINTVVVSLVLAASGCSTTKEDTLPQDGPPMQQIYEAHFQRTRGLDEAGARQSLRDREHSGVAERALAPGEVDLYGYTRDAFNEIDARFPRLPNPTLVMFVYPHLAGDEALPVPGYTTTFPLYERVEYALPGEVPPYIEP